MKTGEFHKPLHIPQMVFYYHKNQILGKFTTSTSPVYMLTEGDRPLSISAPNQNLLHGELLSAFTCVCIFIF